MSKNINTIKDNNVDYDNNSIPAMRQRIAELEEEVKKYKKLLADKTHQFDSVRQRYHLLNRLQAKYDDKHKLHLSEMQCLELVEQNEKLQEENAKLQEQIRTNRKFYKEQLDKFNYESKEIDLFRERCGYDGWDVKDILLDLYKQTTELDKLKEQLKNAIVPKFKQFQKVWYISLTNNICEFEIEEIQWVKCIDGREMITYSNSELGELYEHDLFATEAEAQKYLEEHK